MAKIAKDNKTKRKYIENLFFNVFNKLDSTGKNTDNYKEMFDSMNDDQFFKLMKYIGKRNLQ